MSRFAETTEVPVEKTRAELEALLAKHGATQRATYVDDETGTAAVQFRIGGRMVRLDVVCSAIESYEPASWDRSPPAPHGSGRWTQEKRREWKVKRYEQGARSAWRRLLLVVRAKLEIIADGGSTFEREFLADVLLPDGRKVGELLEAQLDETYRTGGMPPLLGPKAG